MVFNSIFVRKTFSTSITHMTLIQAFMTNVHMLFEQEICGKTFIAILTHMFMFFFSMPEKVLKYGSYFVTKIVLTYTEKKLF